VLEDEAQIDARERVGLAVPALASSSVVPSVRARFEQIEGGNGGAHSRRARLRAEDETRQASSCQSESSGFSQSPKQSFSHGSSRSGRLSERRFQTKDFAPR
jgi:hypothetical protein